MTFFSLHERGSLARMRTKVEEHIEIAVYLVACASPPFAVPLWTYVAGLFFS